MFARNKIAIARSDGDDAIQRLASGWIASLSLAMTRPELGRG